MKPTRSRSTRSSGAISLGCYGGRSRGRAWAALAQLLAATRVVDVDYLGLHERVLGRPVGALLRAASSFALEGLDEQACASLVAGPSVVASTTGYHGDLGIGRPDRLLLNPAVTVDAASLTQARESTGRRASTSFALKRGLVGTFGGGLGLDGRCLVPPFAPWFRQEDHLFGVTLSRAHGNGYVAAIPCAVGHRPVRAASEMPGLDSSTTRRWSKRSGLDFRSTSVASPRRRSSGRSTACSPRS